VATADNAFLFCERSTDTNYQIIRNDDSGSAVVSDTGIAVNTSVNTIELRADAANNFGYSFNGGAFTNFTTDILGATTSITFHIAVENSTITAKTMDVMSFMLK
jgi:hypothetical protein